MSEALYERYKDALRRGHMAALRGDHGAALDAYGEAARIAPDRALPLVGLGNVLAQLGKATEALAAFDAALGHSPTDEGALRGRTEVLVGRGDRAGAAESLDRLAAALDAAGRLPDATDAARRGLELAESRSRRRTVTTFADRLRASAADPAAGEALTRALGVLQGRALDVTSAFGASVGQEPEPEDEPELVAPPFDPSAATAAVEAAAESGDPETAILVALDASAGHRAAGSVGAAIDACYLALGVSPADPRLHLALVELYLDRGWRPLAVDKLALLSSLAALSDDAATLDRVAAIAAARLPDEPRFKTVQG